MSDNTIESIGFIIFLIAVLHTFSVKIFQKMGNRFPSGSVLENLFHFLGEVEVVFIFWSGILFTIWYFLQGSQSAIAYFESRNFTEPLFVLVVMAISATRPVLVAAKKLIQVAAKLLPLREPVAFTLTALFLGPLLGSFITEPAAMTVTALLLKERFFEGGVSSRLKYLALGTLFVNVSIGGTLTPYAAPPVLMVAHQWGWDLSFMLSHFGWKAICAIFCSVFFLYVFGLPEWKDLSSQKADPTSDPRVPFWLIALHFIFLFTVVLFSHHPVLFVGVFLFFMGVVTVTKEYQDELRIRESLLVACFLAGLVILGGLQEKWLQSVFAHLEEFSLFNVSTALTAITDNAALTYLGSLVPGLSESMRYALVSGSVVGGGLTLIANAPNPAGFSILQKSFGDEGINPAGLFLGALFPTLMAYLAFWFLPSVL